MSNWQFPSYFNIRCLVDGRPQEGLLVCLTLRMRRKNDFEAWVNPTNSKGESRITWNEIMSQVREEIKIAQMDYGHLEADFAGEVIATPVNRNDIERALEAYDLYRGATKYPRGWKRQLQQAGEFLREFSPDARIEVEVEHDGAGIKVITVSKFPGKPGK